MLSIGKKAAFSKIAYGSFYLAVIIETLIVVVDKSILVNPMEGRLFQITFVLCLIKVCLTEYSRKEYLVILLFSGLGIISYFATGRNEVLRVVMLVAACKGVEMHKCLKLVFYLTLVGCMLIAGFSVIGIGGSLSVTQDFGRGSLETRYTLGMGHPNAFHCMVWALVLLGMYVYQDSMKWFHYVLLFLVNGGAFALSDSKTSFFVTSVAILSAVLFRYIPILRKSRIIEGLGMIGFLACILVSVLGAANAVLVSEYYWGRDFSAKARFYVLLDKLLTGRLHTLACTINMEGTPETWRLFSNPQSTYFFDLGWVRLFYWFGIIPAIVYIIANIILLHYCYQKRDYMGFLMILSIAVYTVVEAHVISDYIARNYVFFLFGAYWYQIVGDKNGKEVSLWNIVRYWGRTLA